LPATTSTARASPESPPARRSRGPLADQVGTRLTRTASRMPAFRHCRTTLAPATPTTPCSLACLTAASTPSVTKVNGASSQPSGGPQSSKSSSPRTVGLRAPSRRGPLGRRARRGPAAWSPRRSVPADEGRTTARLCQRGTVAVAAARTSTPRPLMFAGQCHGQTPRCAGRRQRRCLGRRSRLLPALRVRGRQAIRTRAAAEQHRPILSRTEPIAFYGAASRPRE
jgi:hypothetical protein